MKKFNLKIAIFILLFLTINKFLSASNNTSFKLNKTKTMYQYCPDCIYYKISVTFNIAKDALINTDSNCILKDNSISPQNNEVAGNLSNGTDKLFLTYCLNNKIVDQKEIKIYDKILIKCTASKKLECN